MAVGQPASSAVCERRIQLSTSNTNALLMLGKHRRWWASIEIAFLAETGTQLGWCELCRLTMKSINHLRHNVNNNKMGYMQIKLTNHVSCNILVG